MRRKETAFLIQSLSLYIPSLADLVLKFFIIRLIVSRLGSEILGTWGILQTVLLFPAFVQQSLTFAIFLLVSKKREQIQHFYIGFVATALFGVFFGLLIILFSPFFISLFRIPENYRALAIHGFRMTAFIFVLGSISQVFLSFLQANHRFRLAGSLLLITSLINSIIDIYLLRAGYGILAMLAVDIFTTSLLCISGMIACSIPILGAFTLSHHTATIREIMREVRTQLVIRSAAAVTWDLDPLIIPRFFGIQTMAFYWIARRIPYILRNLVWTGAIPAVPSVTGDRVRDQSKLQEIFWLQVFLIFPVSIFLFIFSQDILSVWIGKQYDIASGLMRILMVAITMDILPASFFYYFLAESKTGYTIRIPICAALLKSLLSVAACLASNIQLLMLATAAGSMVFFTSMFWAVLRETKWSWNSLLQPFFGSSIGCAAALFVLYLMPAPESLAQLCVSAVLFCGIAYGTSLIVFWIFYPHIFSGLIFSISGVIQKKITMKSAEEVVVNSLASGESGDKPPAPKP